MWAAGAVVARGVWGSCATYVAACVTAAPALLALLLPPLLLYLLLLLLLLLVVVVVVLLALALVVLARLLMVMMWLKAIVMRLLTATVDCRSGCRHCRAAGCGTGGSSTRTYGHVPASRCCPTRARWTRLTARHLHRSVDVSQAW